MSEAGVGSNDAGSAVSPHTLGDLWLVDAPAAWSELGFELKFDTLRLGPVDIHLGSEERALAIVGVEPGTLDGVPLRLVPPRRKWGISHSNDVTGIDHFVIVTPDFDRTVAALDALDLTPRRVRDAGGFRQAFRRLGPAILELVEAPQMPDGSARLWGITFIASDLDALADRLGPDRLRPIKDAVQAGRRIATLDRAAGLTTNVAFMTPEP